FVNGTREVGIILIPSHHKKIIGIVQSESLQEKVRWEPRSKGALSAIGSEFGNRPLKIKGVVKRRGRHEKIAGAVKEQTPRSVEGRNEGVLGSGRSVLIDEAPSVFGCPI